MTKSETADARRENGREDYPWEIAEVTLALDPETESQIRRYAKLTRTSFDDLCWSDLLNQADCLSDEDPYQALRGIREFSAPSNKVEVVLPRRALALLEMAAGTLGVPLEAFLFYLCRYLGSCIDCGLQSIEKLAERSKASAYTMDYVGAAEDAARYSMALAMPPHRIFLKNVNGKGYRDIEENLSARDTFETA
jgi:hypothetical protein